MHHINIAYPLNKVADQLKEMRSELNQLIRKTGLLELKNTRQDGELQFLKTVLSNIVASNQNGDEIVNVAMQKRPARLLPIRLFRYRIYIYFYNQRFPSNI